MATKGGKGKSKRTKQKLTPNQQAWKRETKRIKAFMRRATKRGYIFEGITLPSAPKRITKKSLQQLKDITPDYLYGKAKKLVPGSTDQYMTGTEARAMERRVAYLKGKATRERNQLIKQQQEHLKELSDKLKQKQKQSEGATPVPSPVAVQEVPDKTLWIDEETGEVIAILDDEAAVDGGQIMKENILEILSSMDVAGNPYLVPLADWFTNLIDDVGEQKVLSIMQEVKYFESSFLFAAVRYEEAAKQFVARHMKKFVEKGWMDKAEADKYIEAISIASEDYTDGI